MKNVKDLNAGNWIMHRGEPYKVMKKERVTVGTHMHSKTKLTIQGMLSGSTETLALASHENVEDVEIINKKGQVISKIPPDKVQLMDLMSYETLTATINDEMFNKVGEGSTVTFIEFNGRGIILEARDARA